MTSDFFFSGHCGILTLTTCEMYACKNWKIFFPNLLAIFYVAFCLLAFRGHYIIDITTGIIVA